MKSQQQVQRVLTRVRSGDGKYSWADNDQNRGVMERALAETDAAMTEFGKDFLSMGLSLLNQNLQAAEFWSELELFKNLQSQARKLQQLYKAKYDMHVRQLSKELGRTKSGNLTD